MTIDPTEIDVEALRERYRVEVEKRLRPEGNAQFKELKDEYAEFDDDPYTERIERDPLTTSTEVLVVGGGFAGMLTAIDLGKLGIEDVTIVEKAGDFGGTWYWNRYPGCMCDVESYTYLPLLEETGYMPTEKYASATEIFGYCQLLGRHFDLYDHALFQTVITGAEWDDDSHRWTVTTDRGDTITAHFVVVAGGILHKAKLPGIPGIENFEGHAFHTSRWDYSVDRRQPHRADGQAGRQAGRDHRHRRHRGAGRAAARPHRQGALRLPAHPVRRGRAQPGSHRRRVVQEPPAGLAGGAHRATSPSRVTGAQARGGPGRRRLDRGDVGRHPEAGRVPRRGGRARAQRPRAPWRRSGAGSTRSSTTRRRPRSSSPVLDKYCKRVCFHDDYLPAFNRPNVHLVDTDGRGVDRISPRGPVVDGVEYPVDVLVFASGFEVNTDLDRRVGFDPVGRGGQAMSERWAEGARTLHGVLQGDFPNLMLISLVQAGFGTNFLHFLAGSAAHCAAIVATCRDQGIETIEATPEAEEDWLMVLYGAAGGAAGYVESCTPGFYNSERQAPDAKAARNLVYAGSVIDYLGYLERWRAQGDMPGTKVVKAGS